MLASPRLELYFAPIDANSLKNFRISFEFRTAVNRAVANFSKLGVRPKYRVRNLKGTIFIRLRGQLLEQKQSAVHFQILGARASSAPPCSYISVNQQLNECLNDSSLFATRRIFRTMRTSLPRKNIPASTNKKVETHGTQSFTELNSLRKYFMNQLQLVMFTLEKLRIARKSRKSALECRKRSILHCNYYKVQQ